MLKISWKDTKKKTQPGAVPMERLMIVHGMTHIQKWQHTLRVTVMEKLFSS